MQKILIASHNLKKIVEFKAALEPLGITVLSGADVNVVEPDETGTTFEDNARIKAHAGAKATGHWVLSDDSGIEIPALDHFPGVDTKPWSESIGTYEDATHELLKRVNANETAAQYQCVLVLALPDGREIVSKGTVKGRLIKNRMAADGFGFDPWFIRDGDSDCYANLSLKEKNKTSHRGQALANMLPHIQDLLRVRAVS